ncbi:MAG: hypothetical protein MJA27_28840, partial [Pseudanabaenales cyanobacterium]|nr:hypothetical protein [Pseudanabaenales cyanobacterium]
RLFQYQLSALKQAPQANDGEKKEREKNLGAVQINASISEMLTYEPETFTSTKGIGILCLLPYLQAYGITQVIENSEYKVLRLVMMPSP